MLRIRSAPYLNLIDEFPQKLGRIFHQSESIESFGGVSAQVNVSPNTTHEMI